MQVVGPSLCGKSQFVSRFLHHSEDLMDKPRIWTGHSALTVASLLGQRHTRCGLIWLWADGQSLFNWTKEKDTTTLQTHWPIASWLHRETEQMLQLQFSNLELAPVKVRLYKAKAITIDQIVMHTPPTGKAAMTSEFDWKAFKQLCMCSETAVLADQSRRTVEKHKIHIWCKYFL